VPTRMRCAASFLGPPSCPAPVVSTLIIRMLLEQNQDLFERALKGAPGPDDALVSQIRPTAGARPQTGGCKRPVRLVKAREVSAPTCKTATKPMAKEPRWVPGSAAVFSKKSVLLTIDTQLNNEVISS
jgi:hypothetical protein